MTATNTIEGVEIPATVELPGETVFRLVARMFALEYFVLHLTERQANPVTEELSEVGLGLYRAAFGPAFLDDEDRDAPLYVQVNRLADEILKRHEDALREKFDARAEKRRPVGAA